MSEPSEAATVEAEEEEYLRLREAEDLAADLNRFANEHLKIRTKAGEILPLEFNLAQRYVHQRLEQQRTKTGKVRALLLKARQQGFCLAPETRVLTADYRWVAIDDIQPGDRLVATDEEAPGQSARGTALARRMRTATVQVKAEHIAPVRRVTLDSGAVLIATANHRMLFRRRGACEAIWKEVGWAKPGDVVRRVCDVPAREAGHEDGWFGGLLDGEGSLRTVGPLRLAVSQVDGPVLQRAKRWLSDNGCAFNEVIDARESGVSSKLGKRAVHSLQINRIADLLTILTLCRPTRFTREGLFDNRELPGKSIVGGGHAWARIITIEDLPAQRVIDLQTDTQTFVAEGLVSHNSTYIGARFYHQATHRQGRTVFILTHEQPATDNLFNMVDRYHTHNDAITRPAAGAANAKELTFPVLDSEYAVGTAGAKAVGRSRTVQLFHGSEVAFWPNAKAHFAGVVQTIPDLPGTEIVLESTANGLGNEFHERWQQAEAGIGDYIAIFVPWFWSSEYSREPPAGFTLTEEEQEYADLYGLDDGQMAWRRAKIAELKDPLLFKQEYPATAAEAFQTTGSDSFIKPEDVLRARKASLEGIGPLIIGVDPKREGNDRFSIAWRRGRKVEKVESDPAPTDTLRSATMLKDIIDRDKPARVFIDVGGNGGAIYDVLVSWSEPYASVCVLVNFGSRPVHPPKRDRDGKPMAGPKNRRAEMWDLSRDWLRDEGGADLPDVDSLQADACAPQYHYDATTSQLVLESKEHMVSVRKLRSPDEWDAIALTFAEPVGDVLAASAPLVVPSFGAA